MTRNWFNGKLIMDNCLKEKRLQDSFIPYFTMDKKENFEGNRTRINENTINYQFSIINYPLFLASFALTLLRNSGDMPRNDAI